MKEERIYQVTQTLPNDGERVMCFGHKTYCCSEDMEEEPDWHEVTFKFVVSEYKLKKEVPKDPEETILEYINSVETWDVIAFDEDDHWHVIGVTKWKYINKT